MSEHYSHDIFISFSFADQDIAEEIVNELTSKYGFHAGSAQETLRGKAL